MTAKRETVTTMPTMTVGRTTSDNHAADNGGTMVIRSDEDDEEEEDEPALVPKPWIGDFKHFYFF